MSEKRDVSLSCSLVREVPDSKVREGSVKKPCEGCGREIWISPRAQRHLEDGDVDRVICFYCLDREIRERYSKQKKQEF